MSKEEPDVVETVREAQGDKLPEEAVDAESELPDSEHERIHDSMEAHEEESPKPKSKKKATKKKSKKKTEAKPKPKKKPTETPIEDLEIEKEADVITQLKEHDAVLKKIAEFPTEITGEVKTEQEIPVAEEARHYLHLLEYAGQEIDPLTNEPLSEFRLIISPFDEHITARWIKQRDVVTKHGFDIAPCDYWDTIYKTSIYFDPVGKEVAVYQLIYNSAMSEIGMFAPKVEMELEDEEIVALLDAHIIAEHLRLSAENLTLRKKNRWWEDYTKAIIEAKDDTGGKMFAHMMKMASQLSETDRWKAAGGKGWIEKINYFLIKHPDIKMIGMVGGLIVLVIWMLFGVGILKFR